MSDYTLEDDLKELTDVEFTCGVRGPYREAMRILRFRKGIKDQPRYQPIDPLQTRRLGAYLIAEAERLLKYGSSLDEQSKASFSRNFKPHFLDRVRLVVGETINPPPFASELQGAGFAIPDLSLADAVTLGNVIVASRPLSRLTLMHEMVHVAQWQMLGSDMFAARYLRELSMYGYDSMPLEVMAVDLAFRHKMGEKFSVLEVLFHALSV